MISTEDNYQSYPLIKQSKVRKLHTYASSLSTTSSGSGCSINFSSNTDKPKSSHHHHRYHNADTDDGYASFTTTSTTLGSNSSTTLTRDDSAYYTSASERLLTRTTSSSSGAASAEEKTYLYLPSSADDFNKGRFLTPIKFWCM